MVVKIMQPASSSCFSLEYMTGKDQILSNQYKEFKIMDLTSPALLYVLLVFLLMRPQWTEEMIHR